MPVEIYTTIALGSGRMPSFVEMPFPIMERLTAYISHPDDSEKALAALDARPGSESRYVSAGYLYLRDAQGVPINEPPWGTLTAIDVAAGKLRWQVPLGEYPHLAAKGIVGTGTENYGGAVVTAGGLLFIAASTDEKLRAFDKLTGEELWQTKLPAAGFATPATYSVGGRQFIVLAAGGGKLGTPSGSTYIAFALPENDSEGRGD
jgi:quinoprotein glucose dehydrogenase